MEDGRQELMLSTSEKLITDVYIPTFGLVPNSSYVPATFTNASGHVVVDEYLQVKGAANIWAIGDVSNIEPAQFITCDKQSTHLVKNIVLVLGNKPPLSYKVATSREIPHRQNEAYANPPQVSWVFKLAEILELVIGEVGRYQVS
jgi:apoptosis-inducing factor 2